MPRERAAELLRASDALLVSLSPDPVLESFVPSKLFDFCALGRPVLVAANGEPQRLVGKTERAFRCRPAIRALWLTLCGGSAPSRKPHGA